MKKSPKAQIARALNGNSELNKKAVNIKKSWDEVNGLIKFIEKPKKK